MFLLHPCFILKQANSPILRAALRICILEEAWVECVQFKLYEGSVSH